MLMTRFSKVLKSPYLAILFYYLALFPSRIYRDSTEMMQMMRDGKTTDQWTATYFRFSQIVSINGKYPFFLSLVGILTLYWATILLVNSFQIDNKLKRQVILFFSWTPFLGVFGMTITHEVFYVSGALILISFTISPKKLDTFESKLKIAYAMLLITMDFLGVILLLFFLIVMMKHWNRFLVSFALILTLLFPLFSSNILFVDTFSSGVKLTAFLGDLKCVAQHPNSKISPSELAFIESLAPIELWKEKKSCANSDFAGFAWGSVKNHEMDLIRNWISISVNNPQIVLESRLQRASMSLPPPFFTPQPNMISENYLDPVGLDTSDDLEQWPGLLKTSNDDPFEQKFFIPFFKLFEFIAIFPVYLINRNSNFWGWGGLWFALVIIFQLIGSKKTIMRNGWSIVFLLSSVPLTLLVVSPVASPRYAWLLTYFGLLFSTTFIFNNLKIKRDSEIS